MARVTKHESDKVFKFGAGGPQKSIGLMTIPAEIAGVPINIKTDVVESEVPLLFSLDAMKKAKINLFLVEDKAEVLGKVVPLNYTSSGHYCIPIHKTESISTNQVFAVRHDESGEKRCKASLLKLHGQFAHPVKEKFILLLKDGGAWKSNFIPLVDEIYSKCELCLVYRPTPPKPAVAMPLANHFNQFVAMDLKAWEGTHILHLVDMWSRFSMSSFLERKLPSEVLDKIMLHWCSVFGFMKGIMHDNGGEFNAEEVREVASVLDIIDMSTGAQSPFQNGLCEKIHHVTDRMLVKLIEDNPDTPREVLLAWANNARNCLQMNKGFSPHQLVIGQNPNLPNIITAAPPALDGMTSSEVLARHLNALHSARKAFIQSEADEKIRRALRSKMRSNEEQYSHGDIVYYKRDGKDRWLGPGKVIFQDGKIIFVRHGPTFVRVSANRLMKKGCEFNKNEGENSQNSHSIPIPKLTSHKPCVSEEIGGINHTGEYPDIEKKSNLSLSLKANDIINYNVLPDSDWKVVRVLRRGRKAKGKYQNWFNVEDTVTKEQCCVNLEGVDEWNKREEVLIALIPRSKHKDPDCGKAKQVELAKLRSFGSYIEVEDHGQTALSTTWVLWKKANEVRARLVVRGFEEELDVKKESPTIGKSTMRTLFAIAASKLWVVQTTDIKTKCLPSRQ